MKAVLGSLTGIYLFLLGTLVSGAETMTQQALQEILSKQGKNVEIKGNLVSFSYQEVQMICVSDPNADRMRIFSPIARVTDMPAEMLLTAMAANYHSALDARYAIGDGMVYSLYVHPLSPLTEQQVISALVQVANAQNNFGGSYSSGALAFPAQPRSGGQGEEKPGTLL